MKITELQINDWVLVTDDDTNEAFVGRVTALDLELGNVSVKRKGEETAYPFSVDCIEGIPITHEILAEACSYEEHRLGTSATEVRGNIDKIIAEETHSLREWAQILATNPDLRAEFDKMCPPQPIQGSVAPEADVNRWAVTNAFLHCDKAGKIVSEMYGDKFNNQRNRDKYLAFLAQVNLDDRFGELAGILQRYGAMPAPKEQPEADLEAEIKRYVKAEWNNIVRDGGCSVVYCIARHFAEWGAEHLKK